MTGTLINAGAIILGTLIGMMIKTKLPERVVTIIFQALGLFTILLGLKMALEMQEFLIAIGSLVIGSVIGELLKIESGMEKFGGWVKTKLKSDNAKFTDGMITAFLLYCMGSLTILGAIEEGINGNMDLLLMKSLMDGCSSIALASALGIGVGFSAIPLLIYQGGLTLFASSVSSFFSEAVVRELSAVGGVLLIGLGINILEIKKFRILNMIPALVLVVILIYFFA
ncbi:MAG: hypothetical protein CL663_07565 [Bacteroidetes bacterium]|nr:hypothetical protein [Bacteroidota bacterium]